MSRRAAGYRNGILTVIAALLGAILVVEAAGPITAPAAAQGRHLPNAHRQLDTLIAQAEQTNETLAEIRRLLAEGEAKARIVEPEPE